MIAFYCNVGLNKHVCAVFLANVLRPCLPLQLSMRAIPSTALAVCCRSLLEAYATGTGNVHQLGVQDCLAVETEVCISRLLVLLQCLGLTQQKEYPACHKLQCFPYQRRHHYQHIASLILEAHAAKGYSRQTEAGAVPELGFCHRAKEVYEFAYTYPYSYSELQRWLLGLKRVDAPYLQRRLLCRTPQMKRVDMLTIEELPKSQVGMVRQCLLACIAVVRPVST